MARARNIKPGFFQNEELVELSFEYRLLFIGLWTLADKDGRLEDRPKRIKMSIFPADDVDVESGITQLAGRGFVIRYEVDGRQYLQIANWHKHQSPHHTEKGSDIPPLPNGETTVNSQNKDGGNPPDSLIPDSLIQQPISEQAVVVETSQPAKPAAATKAVRGSRLPADWQLPKAWGEWALQEKPGWTVDDVRRCADKFRDYWHAAAGNSATKASWEATWRNWVRNEQGPPARASPQFDARSADRKRAVAELTGVPITELGGNQNERIEREINPAPRLAFNVG